MLLFPLEGEILFPSSFFLCVRSYICHLVHCFDFDVISFSAESVLQVQCATNCLCHSNSSAGNWLSPWGKSFWKYSARLRLSLSFSPSVIRLEKCQCILCVSLCMCESAPTWQLIHWSARYCMSHSLEWQITKPWTKWTKHWSHTGIRMVTVNSTWILHFVDLVLLCTLD